MTPADFLAMPPAHYSDWFGAGDSHSDFKEAVGDGPLPDEVMIDRNMLLLLWPDRAICIGYDGNKDLQRFHFERGSKP